MARPRIEIDKDQFERLCGLQCTLVEIACYFNCSEDTIEKWCRREYKMGFTDIFHIKRSTGKISLRRSQFRLAETNPTMAIWLGKQYLGQTDKQEIAISSQDDETINSMEKYFSDKKNKEDWCK